MTSKYDQHLPRNPANFAPLSPLGFIQRTAEVYPERLAIVHGSLRQTWSQTYTRCRQLASALQRAGIGKNDTVAVMLPNTPPMVEAHFGVPMAGAVLNALNTRLDPETIAFMLDHGEAKAVIVDPEFSGTMAKALALRQATTPLLIVEVQDELYGAPAQSLHGTDYEAFLASGDAQFAWELPADEWDAIALNYTSGTTGNPKGGLIPHRALVGNLSGFVCSQNLFGFPPEGGLPFPCALPETLPVDTSAAQSASGSAASALAMRADTPPGAEPPQPALPTGSRAVFWSPADWAWTGGLMDALLPTLYFGRPIVAYHGRFSPEVAFRLLQNHGVTHSFLFPTALKAMMKAYPRPREKFRFRLEGLMSAGEAVGDAVFAWCREQLNVVVNEMFGQTEVNYIVGNFCLGRVWGEEATTAVPALGWPAKPGSMGKGYPGHRVTTIDAAGHECPVGVPGEVAIHRRSPYPEPAGQPDPIFMLGYWNKPEATLAKFTGSADDSWFRTGDMAVRDADGYLWYHGRADDVFKVAGYRIGPSEIENCLVKHPAVLNAAVVPKPDRERGALVKAYVVLSPDFMASHAHWKGADGTFDADSCAPLVAELQAHVKARLAPYEYPKEIEFVETLPMTTTGKVQRRILRLQEEERARAASR